MFIVENLSDEALFIEYQKAKYNFRISIEGSKEEYKTEQIFSRLYNEIIRRKLDIRKFR